MQFDGKIRLRILEFWKLRFWISIFWKIDGKFEICRFLTDYQFDGKFRKITLLGYKTFKIAIWRKNDTLSVLENIFDWNFFILSDDSIVCIFCNQFRATLEGTPRNLASETRFLIQIHVIVGTKKHQKNAAFSVAKEIDFSTPIVFLPKVQRIAKINSRIICKAFRNHNQSLSGRWRFQNFFVSSLSDVWLEG